MANKGKFLADSLSSLGTAEKPVTVSLSNELVALLSEQLYQSPLKAIEELVVNSYDAEATVCRLWVPNPTELSAAPQKAFAVVYDDGSGMSHEGLVNLWQIGRSNKRSEEIAKVAKRTQIGKFGIGKLATYTIANRLTYITKTGTGILTVTIDFTDFKPAAAGAVMPVALPVRKFTDLKTLVENPVLKLGLDLAKVTEDELKKKPTWTIALLEDLKAKASQIRTGKLHWVLSTAMPLRSDFKVHLNGTEVVSSKESFQNVVSFAVKDLSPCRIDALSKSTGEEFTASKTGINSTTFPNGIIGNVFVTHQSLHGKSDDLSRSGGFFIRVRGRLINEDDPLFGMDPLSHQTFNRFRADLQVDDLDPVLTAPREGVENSPAKQKFESVLKAIFYEARDLYEAELKKRAKGQENKNEISRDYVAPELVEYPVADVLVTVPPGAAGSEADSGWFYLDVDPKDDLKETIKALYSGERKKYTFSYSNLGRNERLVKFDPKTATFVLNQDHEFVLAHADNPRAQLLLEDFVVSEVLLEVYLKEHQVSGSVIGDVLQRRDNLLRSLPSDHPYSLKAVAAALRDSASDERNLEMNLVAAARAMGFVASHISGAGEPDGLARFTDYPDGEKLITLEAKSSEKVPSLSAIDFAGLREHVIKHVAQGCLLVAPDYPGRSGGDYSAAACRVQDLKISCWTVDQLAKVVEAVEAKHVTAARVLDVVLNEFSPDEVAAALESVFGEPRWEKPKLYQAIIRHLKQLQGKAPKTIRNVSHLVFPLSSDPTFAGIDEDDIRRAVAELAAASKGTIELRDSRIILLTSFEEIERRLSGLLEVPGEPRRPSQFRDHFGTS